jgi:hypothetical protein
MIPRKCVDGDHRGDAVQADILDLLAEVPAAAVDVVGILLQQRGRQRPAGHDAVPARMDLERADGRDHHGRLRTQPGGPALDVEEFLRADIGAEAGLGYQKVASVDADEVGDHRGIAVGDIAERARVHEHGGVLHRLQQVRLDRLTHDHGHGAGGLELLGGDRLPVTVVPDQHPAEALAHVLERARQRQHRHDLRGGGDVEAALAGNAVLLGSKATDDVAQRPVVDVEHSPPGHLVLVDAELVALVDVVVDHGGEQIVRRGDRVRVPREVKVQQLHRHDLAVAATGGAALDAEGGAHGGLPDRHRGLPADMGEGLAEADRGGGLALAEGSRRDRRHDHIARRGTVGQRLDRLQSDLRHPLAIGLEHALAQTHLRSDLQQGLGMCPSGDLEVVQDRACHGQLSLYERGRPVSCYR